LGRRPADKPLDGFDRLTAGMLGALSLSKRRRLIQLHESGYAGRLSSGDFTPIPGFCITWV
jgi:hypothetical protein